MAKCFDCISYTPITNQSGVCERFYGTKYDKPFCGIAEACDDFKFRLKQEQARCPTCNQIIKFTGVLNNG